VSPYLGGDTVKPFIARPERGAFVLCKTSNPGADEFQSLDIDGCALFEVVAEHAQTWNANRNVGLVVGATDPSSIARVRDIAPDLWFLVPGIGAQGGDLQRTMQAGLRADGMGLLINASRAIANARDPRAQAKQLRDEINQYRSSPVTCHTPLEKLANDLIVSGCVRFGQFTLKSGIVSPIYLDLRQLISHPAILQRVARAYGEKLRALSFDRIAGIPYAGLPIGTAVSLEINRPLIYARREAKEYGTRASIEGEYKAGETIAVIDDLATTGGTKIEAIEKLTSAGLVVRDIVVLIDREQGAGEMLKNNGYYLHSVATLSQLLEEWKTSGAITTEQYAQVKEFIANK
jgi:uridine monophosphate synthetase